MHAKPIFKLLLLLLPSYLFAQNNAGVVLQGVVYAHKTQKPLPFATVAIKGQTIGTVSNQQGRFILRVPDKLKNGEIVFSHIGYKPKVLSIQQSLNIIKCYLEEDTQLLKEVVVTGLTASTIIRKAIEKIPENYYQKPYISQGFYRLTTQKDPTKSNNTNPSTSNQYIQASEASFEIYNAQPVKKNQLKLNKMRAIKHERFMQNMELRLKPAGVFEMDIVPHLDDERLFNRKVFRNHVFTLKGTRNYLRITFCVPKFYFHSERPQSINFPTNNLHI